MSSLESLEAELLQRPPGWWDRLVDSIPELAALDRTPQSPLFHAEGDVGVHTRMAVLACPADGDADLAWVALLHDIGKPLTTVDHGNGKITSYNHDRSGAELASQILERLGMSGTRRERIVWVVRHHMFHLTWQLTSAEQMTHRQRNYLRHPDFPLLLEFLRIDALASRGRTTKLQAYEFYCSLWQQETGLAL